MSGFSKHWEFVKEISAPLKKPEPKFDIFDWDDVDKDDDFDLQAELDAKFEELFGTLEDDDDDN